MTRQRPRKTQAVESIESTEPTAEPISAVAPATATPADDDHLQEPDRGGSPRGDAAGVEPAGPAASAAPAALTERLTPEPAPASPTTGEAQSRGSRPPRQPRPTKLARLQAMLRTPAGASLPALREATGWQAHTLRAALTRLRQAGHAVERGRSEGGVTTYRIVESDCGPAAGEATSLNHRPARADAISAGGPA